MIFGSRYFLLVGAVLLLVFLRTPVKTPLKISGTQPLVFFEKDYFFTGILNAKQGKNPLNNRIAGGIIPHHLLASNIIADFFSRLAVQKPTTVILIGPNHYEKGDDDVLSSDFRWQTPFGVVSPDIKIITELKNKSFLQIDNAIAEKEHSVAGIMPFIKYYVPDAVVVPLIIKSGLSLEKINLLATSIAQFKGNVVVIASVDFSHYLNSAEAQTNDAESLLALRQYDFERLLSFRTNNEHLDSPASIVLLLKTMQQKGTTQSEILQHTNSGIIQNKPFQQTTSYFGIAYY